MTTIVGNIKRRGTVSAESEIMNMFSSPVMLKGSSVAVKAAINEINKLETVNREAVLAVTERYSKDDFGTGMIRLEESKPELTSTKKKLDLIAASGKLPELDKVAKSLTPLEFNKFSSQLVEASSGTDASSEKIAKIIEEKHDLLSKGSTTLASRRAEDSLLKISSLRSMG